MATKCTTNRKRAYKNSCQKEGCRPETNLQEKAPVQKSTGLTNNFENLRMQPPTTRHKT